MWCVYIVECSDGSFYTGLTNNLERRLREHNDSRGARYTRLNGPVKLRYTEEFHTRLEASQREVSIKKLERFRKDHLIKHGKGKRLY